MQARHTSAVKKVFSPRQELAALQNQLLLLFLKYNLSFRYSEHALTEIPGLWQKKRDLLVHCFLHAVVGNTSAQHPKVKLEVKVIKGGYRVEISSTGKAESFYQAISAYCQDSLIQQYFGLLSPEWDIKKLEKEGLMVIHDSLSEGCLICLHFMD